MAAVIFPHTQPALATAFSPTRTRNFHFKLNQFNLVRQIVARQASAVRAHEEFNDIKLGRQASWNYRLKILAEKCTWAYFVHYTTFQTQNV